MHSGTTRDTFLRENLDWLVRAINWSKFSTTAGLGVIHKGHLKEAMKVLDPYLPKPGQELSPYTAGGSLYALGIVHANHGVGLGKSVSEYLLTQVRENAANDVVVHGACLGLGLASMASGSQGMIPFLLFFFYISALGRRRF